MPSDRINALLAIDKPIGLTSHDVVDRVRKIIKQRSVGHTGTLDPLASGLLLLCLGKVTKLARFFSGQDKTYKATICLGLTSTTFDAEGIDEQSRQLVPELTQEAARDILQTFVGLSVQTVPVHSAIRVDGERLYEKARRGEATEPPQREINISRIKLNKLALPEITFTTTVSSGTYIRSLAHDIGQKIGCGAYLKELQRTEIGGIKLDSATTLDQLAAKFEANDLSSACIPLDRALGFGAVRVTEQFTHRISQGRALQNADIKTLEGEFNSGDHILIKSPEGEILAVGTALKNSVNFRDGSAGDLFRYERVLV